MALKVTNLVEKKTLSGEIDGIEVVLDYECETGKTPVQITARATLNEAGAMLTVAWYAVNKNLSISTYNLNLTEVPADFITKIINEVKSVVQ